MSKVITLDSYNLYSTKFPERRLVTKGMLELIKELRKNGYEVHVRPENDQPIQYLYHKGENDFFSNPVYVFLAGIPVAIIVNLISNYVQRAIDKWNQTEEIKNNIIIVNNESRQIIDANQKALSFSEVNDKKTKSKYYKREFDKCFSIESPYRNLPTPIFLNHKPKVIGWGRLKATYTTLEFDEAIITDKAIQRKVNSGKIKGASLTGIAEKSICSICKNNYVECNHIAGDVYDGVTCSNQINQATIIEVSLVNEPINSECVIKLVK